MFFPGPGGVFESCGFPREQLNRRGTRYGGRLYQCDHGSVFIGPIKTLKINKPQNLPLTTRDSRRVDFKPISNHSISHYLSTFLLVSAEQESIKL